MQVATETSFSAFESSKVYACFIPADQKDEYYVKMHVDDPERPAYMIGSVGNSHGTPELFRVLLPTPLAVGNRGTIINLSNAAIRACYPTFATQGINIDGYHVISPHFGAPSFRVGRLVALAWLPRPEEATEVDHIDGDPAHDELSNLEWVSHSENLRRGRHSKPCGWNDEDYVLMVRAGYEPRLVHPSEVTSIIGSRNTSHVLRRGTRKSANGWYMCLNPNYGEAVAFVEGLPLKDKVYYLEAVADLFHSLEIG